MGFLSKTSAVALGITLSANGLSAAAATEQQRIEQLEQTVEQLKQTLQQLTGMSVEQVHGLLQSMQSMQQKVDAANHAAEAAADAVEKSTAEAQAKADKVHVGGYGEVTYNNLSARDSSESLREADFKRFVLFFGYDFSDKLRFNSELEVEHAVSSSDQADPGEVEVEQGYIQYDITNRQSVLGGLFLVPVGILNETHEPTTFYGVERNDVETLIIPTTWREIGTMYSYNLPFGLGFDVAAHTGLAVPTDGDEAFQIAHSKQEGAQASAKDLASTIRLRYSGIPGLNIATSFQYQSDPSQARGDGLDSGYLYEGHIDYSHGPFGLRALYSAFHLNGDAARTAHADDQWGFYVEPSFKILPNVGLYTRYEQVDAAPDENRFDQWEAGINFWPHPNVVLKADFRTRDHDRGSEKDKDFDGFDLGIGYRF